VYHTDPSGAYAGSCGRDPAVGTCHSWIATCTLPGITTASGAGFGGRFFVKYAITVPICSFGTGAPWFTIMFTTDVHSAWLCPAFVTVLSAWHVPHAFVTASFPAPSGNAAAAPCPRAAACVCTKTLPPTITPTPTPNPTNTTNRACPRIPTS